MEQLNNRSDRYSLLNWDNQDDDVSESTRKEMGFSPKDLLNITKSRSDLLAGVIGVSLPDITQRLSTMKFGQKESVASKKPTQAQINEALLERDLKLSDSEDELEDAKPPPPNVTNNMTAKLNKSNPAASITIVPPTTASVKSSKSSSSSNNNNNLLRTSSLPINTKSNNKSFNNRANSANKPTHINSNKHSDTGNTYSKSNSKQQSLSSSKLPVSPGRNDRYSSAPRLTSEPQSTLPYVDQLKANTKSPFCSSPKSTPSKIATTTPQTKAKQIIESEIEPSVSEPTECGLSHWIKQAKKNETENDTSTTSTASSTTTPNTNSLKKEKSNNSAKSKASLNKDTIEVMLRETSRCLRKPSGMLSDLGSPEYSSSSNSSNDSSDADDFPAKRVKTKKLTKRHAKRPDGVAADKPQKTKQPFKKTFNSKSENAARGKREPSKPESPPPPLKFGKDSAGTVLVSQPDPSKPFKLTLHLSKIAPQHSNSAILSEHSHDTNTKLSPEIDSDEDPFERRKSSFKTSSPTKSSHSPRNPHSHKSTIKPDAPKTCAIKEEPLGKSQSTASSKSSSKSRHKSPPRKPPNLFAEADLNFSPAKPASSKHSYHKQREHSRSRSPPPDLSKNDDFQESDLELPKSSPPPVKKIKSKTVDSTFTPSTDDIKKLLPKKEFMKKIEPPDLWKDELLSLDDDGSMSSKTEPMTESDAESQLDLPVEDVKRKDKMKDVPPTAISQSKESDQKSGKKSHNSKNTGYESTASKKSLKIEEAVSKSTNYSNSADKKSDKDHVKVKKEINKENKSKESQNNTQSDSKSSSYSNQTHNVKKRHLNEVDPGMFCDMIGGAKHTITDSKKAKIMSKKRNALSNNHQISNQKSSTTSATNSINKTFSIAVQPQSSSVKLDADKGEKKKNSTSDGASAVVRLSSADVGKKRAESVPESQTSPSKRRKLEDGGASSIVPDNVDDNFPMKKSLTISPRIETRPVKEEKRPHLEDFGMQTDPELSKYQSDTPAVLDSILNSASGLGGAMSKKPSAVALVIQSNPPGVSSGSAPPSAYIESGVSSGAGADAIGDLVLRVSERLEAMQKRDEARYLDSSVESYRQRALTSREEADKRYNNQSNDYPMFAIRAAMQAIVLCHVSERENVDKSIIQYHNTVLRIKSLANKIDNIFKCRIKQAIRHRNQAAKLEQWRTLHVRLCTQIKAILCFRHYSLQASQLTNCRNELVKDLMHQGIDIGELNPNSSSGRSAVSQASPANSDPLSTTPTPSPGYSGHSVNVSHETVSRLKKFLNLSLKLQQANEYWRHADVLLQQQISRNSGNNELDSESSVLQLERRIVHLSGGVNLTSPCMSMLLLLRYIQGFLKLVEERSNKSNEVNNRSSNLPNTNNSGNPNSAATGTTTSSHRRRSSNASGSTVDYLH